MSVRKSLIVTGDAGESYEALYAVHRFREAEYSQILKSTLEMDDLIRQHSQIMDKYDPQKRVALVVDEWGAWYAPLPGSNLAFLVQQNSLRDAILAALKRQAASETRAQVRNGNLGSAMTRGIQR
jgi:alpha-N-arabinofuranosidase